MDRYVFPGFPVFQVRAAERLGVAATVMDGKPLAAIASLANLCAQAALADSDHVATILAEATLYSDRLIVAAEAAQMMLDEVGDARGLPRPIPARGDISATTSKPPLSPSL